MVEKPKTEVPTDNGLPPTVLYGRVSRSISGDRRVPQLRNSSMVWIWQHDKRTDDHKIILNCVRKLMKNRSENEAGKGPSFKKVLIRSILRLLSLKKTFCDCH